jgi:hypothetical protein
VTKAGIKAEVLFLANTSNIRFPSMQTVGLSCSYEAAEQWSDFMKTALNSQDVELLQSLDQIPFFFYITPSIKLPM